MYTPVFLPLSFMPVFLLLSLTKLRYHVIVPQMRQTSISPFAFPVPLLRTRVRVTAPMYRSRADPEEIGHFLSLELTATLDLEGAHESKQKLTLNHHPNLSRRNLSTTR